MSNSNTGETINGNTIVGSIYDDSPDDSQTGEGDTLFPQPAPSGSSSDPESNNDEITLSDVREIALEPGKGSLFNQLQDLGLPDDMVGEVSPAVLQRTGPDVDAAQATAEVLGLKESSSSPSGPSASVESSASLPIIPILVGSGLVAAYLIVG